MKKDKIERVLRDMEDGEISEACYVMLWHNVFDLMGEQSAMMLDYYVNSTDGYFYIRDDFCADDVFREMNRVSM